MPWGQSSRANVRKQPKLWDRQKGKRKEREFSHEAWPTHRTKDWANNKGELASCIPLPLPTPSGREAGMRQPDQEGKGLLQSQPQRLASSSKLWAGSQLLTTSSWDPVWLISARRVAAWDQLPRGDTWYTWDGALAAHPGLGRPLRCTAYLGQCAHQAPGKGTKCMPNRACALAEYPRTWT